MLLLAGAVRAQIPQTIDALSGEQGALLSEQARRGVTDRILSASGIPLEGALDPDTYIVGPGDVFTVSIGGAIPVQLAPKVTADGALIIPELGSLPVAGLTLATVQEQVRVRLRRSYRNVATDVALAQPRQFYVHVSGEVSQPGRHVAIPVARVEDALAAAMGGAPLLTYQQQRRENVEILPALRNVEVRHKSGERITVDLMRYYATGDIQFNPYLEDGDALYVPGFQKDVAALYVDRGTFTNVSRGVEGFGIGTERAHSSTELFDYRQSDSVTDLLLVAGGPDLLASTESVRLVRTLADGRLETRVLDIPAILAEVSEDPLLQPLDHIQVQQRRRQAGIALAEGFVTHPGTYPIIEGETTLQDLISAAGGIAPQGLLRGAYLERMGAKPTSGFDESSAAVTTAYLNQREATFQRELFETARLSGLSFGSRQYLAREVLEGQRVSLNFSGGIENLPAIPLRDGDRLIVPRDPKAVLVVGQIRYPGYVPFKAGADADYYLAQAGGKTLAASETYLREASTGAFLSPSEIPIQSGDALFVDRIPVADTESLQALVLQERQLAIQENGQRAERRFRYIQTALSIVSTAAGIVTAYLLIRDRNDPSPSGQ